MGVDAVGLVEVNLGGTVGIEDRIEVDPFAATDGKQGPLLPRFGPHVGGAGVVGGMGRVGEIHHGLPAASQSAMAGQSV